MKLTKDQICRIVTLFTGGINSHNVLNTSEISEEEFKRLLKAVQDMPDSTQWESSVILNSISAGPMLHEPTVLEIFGEVLHCTGTVKDGINTYRFTAGELQELSVGSTAYYSRVDCEHIPSPETDNAGYWGLVESVIADKKMHTCGVLVLEDAQSKDTHTFLYFPFAEQWGRIDVPITAPMEFIMNMDETLNQDLHIKNVIFKSSRAVVTWVKDRLHIAGTDVYENNTITRVAKIVVTSDNADTIFCAEQDLMPKTLGLPKKREGRELYLCEGNYIDLRTGRKGSYFYKLPEKGPLEFGTVLLCSQSDCRPFSTEYEDDYYLVTVRSGAGAPLLLRQFAIPTSDVAPEELYTENFSGPVPMSEDVSYLVRLSKNVQSTNLATEWGSQLVLAKPTEAEVETACAYGGILMVSELHNNTAEEYICSIYTLLPGGQVSQVVMHDAEPEELFTTITTVEYNGSWPKTVRIMSKQVSLYDIGESDEARVDNETSEISLENEYNKKGEAR